MQKATHTHSSLFEKAHNVLKQADRVLIVTHQRPDGDALGSALSVSKYCDDLNTPNDIFCVHAAPEYFSYLPNVKHIQTDPSLIIDGDHTVLITLDSGDLVYAGVHEHIGKRQKDPHTIINIDHHPTNTHYGDINIVDPDSSSTAELLYHFFQHTGHNIDHQSATCLLTGIITDTGGFSNLATTSSSLTVASDLLSRGARIWDIQTRTLKNKPINALKVWGAALSRLRRHPSGIITTVLTQEDLQKNNAGAEHIEGMANFLNSLEDAKAVALISEVEPGRIKVSLRTTQDDVDVSKLARLFGGGGHVKAAGFSFPGRIQRKKGWFEITN